VYIHFKNKSQSLLTRHASKMMLVVRMKQGTISKKSSLMVLDPIPQGPLQKLALDMPGFAPQRLGREIVAPVELDALRSHPHQHLLHDPVQLVAGLQVVRHLGQALGLLLQGRQRGLQFL